MSGPPASAPVPRAVRKCGFGFVFELLDDYYPAPNAAFFVCDQQERVIDAGKGSFELTGLTDEDVIGRPVREVLGLSWIDERRRRQGGRHQRRRRSPTRLRPRWSGAFARSASGSRSTPRATSRHKAVADLFPAYDDDGGLLIVLTPEG